MDEIQKLLFVIDADTSPIEQKFGRVTKGAVDLQGAEREAYLQQLGIMQKLRVEAELLRKVRERSNDPKSIQEYSKRLQELTNQSKQLTSALQPRQDNIFTSIKQGLGIGTGFSLVQGLQRAAGMLLEYGKASLMAADASKNNRQALEGIFQSREKALQLDRQTVELAAKSPLRLDKAREYAQGLAGVDIALKDITKDIKAVGDVAAGSGNFAKLDNIMLAYKQVASTGYLQGDEARQFLEANIPIYKELAKISNKSVAQIKKDVEDGKVSFSQVRDVFRSLSGEGGKFFNAMEKQSQSLTGKLSNLSDSWVQLETELGERFMPTAKGVIDVLNDLVITAKEFVEVPMSEKLQDEQAAMNGLVLAAVSMNDNYETRANLIREIKQEYPDFLAGLDAETVSNDQLIKRLREVNELYRTRIQLAVSKEAESKVAEKVTNYDKRAVEAQQKALATLTRAIQAGGGQFDTEGFKKATNKRAFIESQLERAQGLNVSQVKEILAYAPQAQIGNSKLQRELSDLTKQRLDSEKENQNAELDYKRKAVEQAKQGIDFAKKERDRFTKDSEEYRYYNDIVTRQESANKKLKIEYAKAEIERLDNEIQTSGSKISGLENAFNDATLNRKNKAQVRLDLADERKKYAALAKERAKFEREVPKELTSDPKADKAAQTARDKAKRDADKLKEDRIKAKEDLAKELAKLNADIAKEEDKDGYQTIERIKKRIEAETKVEMQGLKNKQADLVRAKIFSQKESDELFAPVFEALRKKQSLIEINDIKKFKEEARKVEKENNDKLISLTLDAQTEKLNLLSDSLDKENKLVFDNFDRQEREITRKFSDLRTGLESDYKKGLFSIAETDLVALGEAATKYAAQLAKIDALEKDALERNIKARDNAILVLNQKALDASKKASGEVYNAFETGRSEGEAQQIQTETERYIRGQIRYEEYQKRISAIQRQYELNRKRSRIEEISDEIKDIEKRIDATTKSNQGIAVDASLVLNDTDLKNAQLEIVRLRGELAKAQSDYAQTQAGNKAGDSDAWTEKLNKIIDGYAAVTDAALTAFKTINDAELKSLDYSIDAQKNRIEQAKVLRDRGNTEILDEEEKRLRILDERRRKALARQQFLDRLAQLSSVSVGVAKAFAESGGKFTAVTIAASIAALIAGYSLVNSIVPTQTQRFAKGTPFVRRPMGVPTGIDTVPAMLTEGERVTDAQTNKEYGESMDILTSRKISAKEAKRRLMSNDFTDVDGFGVVPSESRTTIRERRLKMNYERLAASNAFKAEIEAKKSRADELMQRQIAQNDEIILLLKSNKSQVNLSMDRRGFSLSVSEALFRENKRRG